MGGAMRRFFALAAFGFAVLAFAAVWLGGLNQDEGWYLYAANLVAEGKAPYRDFFFTQGPLMPRFYANFTWIWRQWGLLGARVFTLTLGAIGLGLYAVLASRLAPRGKERLAALLVFLLLGGNIYHLYYLAVPKTYSLAALCMSLGLLMLSSGGAAAMAAAGACLAFAAGVRASLVVLLPVVALILAWKAGGLRWLWFSLGAAAALACVYIPCILAAPGGLSAAQAYHAARGGFDIVFTVGSLSRLVRWYMPVVVLLGLGLAGLPVLRGGCGADSGGRCRMMLWILLAGFLAVFAVQMLAPFPYEDYQVPVMGLLAVAAAVMAVEIQSRIMPASKGTGLALLALGMAWTTSFGSPLLQEWMINGQDRFWSLKKSRCELGQLRDVAREINALDPGGKMILTQDLYIAVETGRKVPEGLEMGPFSYWGDGRPACVKALDHDGMRRLLEKAPCEIAAASGYTFAICAPQCSETPMERQMELWRILKEKYDLVFKEDDFGQNATPLLVLRRRAASCPAGSAGGSAAEGM